MTSILKRPGIVTMILTLSILISLICLALAFIQKTRADVHQNLAVQCLHTAESQRLIAEESRLEADRQRLISAESKLEAELARQKLAACAGR